MNTYLRMATTSFESRLEEAEENDEEVEDEKVDEDFEWFSVVMWD